MKDKVAIFADIGAVVASRTGARDIEVALACRSYRTERVATLRIRSAEEADALFDGITDKMIGALGLMVLEGAAPTAPSGEGAVDA